MRLKLQTKKEVLGIGFIGFFLKENKLKSSKKNFPTK